MQWKSAICGRKEIHNADFYIKKKKVSEYTHLSLHILLCGECVGENIFCVFRGIQSFCFEKGPQTKAYDCRRGGGHDLKGIGATKFGTVCLKWDFKHWTFIILNYNVMN